MFTDRVTRAQRAAELVRRRLAAFTNVSDQDIGLIERMGETLEAHPAGTAVTGVRVLVSGWACRRQLLSDGSRQIFAFLTPGDLIEGGPSGGRGRIGYTALTPAETVSAAGLATAAEGASGLGLAEGMAGLREEQERLLLDHIIRLGRLTAYQRTAHLMLELRERLARVGLADEERLPMPLTQETLADALGLSIVHVNRTLQQLRRDGLLELKGGVAVLSDRQALAELCGYEPPVPRRRGAPAPLLGSMAASGPQEPQRLGTA